MKFRSVIILFAATFLFAACSSERKADLTGIDFDVKIERFDSAFWMLDTANLQMAYSELCEKYPDMTRVYIEHIVRFGEVDAPEVLDIYRRFRCDTSVQKVYNSQLEYFADVDDLNKELTMAFRRAKAFFPHCIVPQVFMHASGFNQSVVVGSDSLGLHPFISLSGDNYLGTDFEVYRLIQIYDYQLQNMRREKIVSDYILAWLYSEYELPVRNALGEPISQTLLNDIIYRGKMLYVATQLLPNQSEAQIIGYTDDQYKWCKDNERAMWKTLVASGELYQTNPIKKGHYVNDGPFTLPFTQESPSRAGSWVGLQIIKSYMKHNKEVSIAQLMQQLDGQTILNESRYNP